MKLIGRYASPYVSRVAITLQYLGLPYTHQVISPITDPAGVRAINPMGKVPVLQLDDGTKLLDSTAILDYILTDLSPDRTLLPASGTTRRQILQWCTIATTVLEKALYAGYEISKRPLEKHHLPAREDLLVQAAAGLTLLEPAAANARPWLTGAELSLADITVGAMWRFLQRTNPALTQTDTLPALSALAARCADLPAFKACEPEA